MSARDIAERLRELRHLTAARIGLRRAGTAQMTSDILAFDLACAQARDAVSAPLDVARLLTDLAPLDCIAVHSAAADRPEYLLRPDLGRRLDDASAACLTHDNFDLVIVLGDGLSHRAVQTHGPPMVRALMLRLAHLRIAPIVIAQQARVAIADDVGERVGARAAVILIGERPGLSTHDSLGIYMTYEPRVGRSDAEKNCISNLHDNGLSHAQAADQLANLLERAYVRRVSGIALNTTNERLAKPGDSQRLPSGGQEGRLRKPE